MKNPFTKKPAVVREFLDETLTAAHEPGDILDRFIGTVRSERDAHLAAIETLEQEIEYKTACLRNHRMAFEACNAALMPLCNEQFVGREPEKPLMMENGTLKMNPSCITPMSDVTPPSTLQTAMRNVDDFSAMEKELGLELEHNVWSNGKDAPEANRNSGTTSKGTDGSGGKTRL